MYTVEDIEDFILAALKSSTLAQTVKTIETYHGELEMLMEEIKRLTVSLPACFVLYGGSKFTETANRSYDDEPTYTIVLISKDLRGRSQLRTGMYAMLEIVKDTLIDNDFGCKNIEPLHPVAIEPVLVTKEFSVYAFDVKTLFSRD